MGEVHLPIHPLVLSSPLLPLFLSPSSSPCPAPAAPPPSTRSRHSETLLHTLNPCPKTVQEQEQDQDEGMPAIRADEDIVMHSNAGSSQLIFIAAPHAVGDYGSREGSF